MVDVYLMRLITCHFIGHVGCDNIFDGASIFFCRDITFPSRKLKIKESRYLKLKVNNFRSIHVVLLRYPLLYAFLLVSRNLSIFETTVSHLWNTDIWSFNGITGNCLLHGSSNGKFGTCMELFNDIYASPLLTPSPNVSTFCCSILLY